MPVEQLVLTAEPAARQTDPDTSHAAARRVLKGSVELEQRIADECTRPLTAEQIAAEIVASTTRWDWSS
jgi:hypothetical protein